MHSQSSRWIPGTIHTSEPMTPSYINDPRHVMRLQLLLYQDGGASETVESIVNPSLRCIPGERAIREFLESFPGA